MSNIVWEVINRKQCFFHATMLRGHRFSGEKRLVVTRDRDSPGTPFVALVGGVEIMRFRLGTGIEQAKREALVLAMKQLEAKEQG